MRFPHVAVGQRFSYQGKLYTKTGPLTASEESTGERRLIPKATEVSLVDGLGESLRETKQRYTRAELERVLERFKADLVGGLREMAVADGSLQLDQVIELIRNQQSDG